MSERLSGFVEINAMKTKRFSNPAALTGWFLTAILFFLAVQARASFHLMQIEEVIGGVNGDTTAQAIQLRMRASGENFVTGAQLIAVDAAGNNPITVATLTSDVG